nr:leucine-rich repeat protein [Oscillospiraceae bacterium]
MLKRMISFLLAVVLLVGLVPVGAAATETTVDTGEMTIEGTNALGDLLTEEISAYQNANLTAMDEYESGFSVTNLTFSGATATVTYDAAEEATLVVAVYTEDGLTLLNSAYKTVSPDNTTATVTISGEMPEFFTASAYLLNSYDLAPLCAAYRTSLYTRSIQDLKNSTVEDFPQEKVLNLDEDNTTNFAVYTQTAVVIDAQDGVNTVVSADDETRTYVIANADAQFTSLQPGDVVAYEYGAGQFLFAKVDALEASGNTVTIHGGELELSDVFSHVKIEGDSANAEVTYDPSTLSEGLTLAPASRASSTEVSGTGTVSQEFTVFDTGALTGTLGFQVDVTLNFYAVEDYCFLELRDDFTITLNATFEGKFSASKRLGKFGVAFAYGSIYVGLEPTVNFSAEAEAEFEGTITAMVGCQVDSVLGASSISRSPVASYDFRAEGSVYLGVDLNPTVELLGGYLADGDLTLAAGVRIDGELTGGITSGSTEEQEPEDTIHTCEICFDLNGYCQLNFAAAVSFLKQDSLTFTLVDNQKDIHIGQWYYSADHEEFDEGECPYKSHKVTVEVLNSDGGTVSGAAVEVSQAGQVEENGYTGGNGVYSVYLSEGSHTIRAVHGELRRTVTENVTEPGKVTITLPETPDEPEETTPSAPGGVLEGVESVPAGGSWELEESGWFASNPAMTWEIYSGSAGTKVVFTGSGEVDNVLVSSGRYEYYDEEHDMTVEKEKNVWPAATEVVFGEGITAITTRVYAYRSVSLPSTLREIGDNVFYESELKQISLPAGLKTIGANAFAKCTNLKSIVIPGSVKEIGEAAFESCFKLEQVVLGEGVIKIGGFAFTSCPELKTIQLPSTLKVIGQSAFDASGLQAITIPGSVQEMGRNAFLGCANLRSVTILPGVTCIGEYTFQGCSSMTSLSLPEGLNRIESFAFHHCDSLTDVTIPKTVEFIGQHAFSYCRKLKNLTFEGFDLADGKDYGITFHSLAFELCAVTELKLPAIDSAWGLVFKECEYLDTIVLDGCIYELHDEGGEGGYGGSPLAYCDPGTIYYPDAYSEEKLPANDPAAAAYYYTKDRMWDIHSGATWIPYTVDESGNMIPDESRAYCPYTGGWYSFGNSSETIPEETATETIPAETVPVETFPEMTEPAETAPIETEAPEAVPVETAETLPEETNFFVSVELPTPAAANTFRVSAPAPSVRALSSGEQTMQASAPAMASLYGGEYSSEVTENKTFKTASFSDLVPGKEYVLLALASLSAEDPLNISNLIHIDQGVASAEGTLSFRYVERQEFSTSYVMVSGPSSKDLADADITFPRAFANGEEQVIHPTVVYGGKILTENRDYVLSGKLSFTEAGEYTCYIRGIYDYTGVVQCTYTVEEAIGTQPPVERPPVEAVKLFEGETDLSKKTVWEKQLNKDTANGFTVELTGEVTPAEAQQDLKWSSSDTSVAAVSAGKVTFTGKAGDVTITAEAKDGSDISAQVTYRILAPVEIEVSGDSDIRLVGGKSTTLKVINKDTGKAVKAKDIVWTLDAGNQDASAFATISKSGKLTSKKVVSRADLTVYGEVYSNNHYVDTVVYTVSIYPAAAQVEIFSGAEMVNGKTVPVDTSGDEVVLPELSARVYPTDAMEDVTWKSSSKKIAQIDPVTGELTWMGKNGTVTVTATANDGSKKKATVKLTFGTLAEDLSIGIKEKKQIIAAEEADVISGKSIQLAAELTGSPTNKKVTWSLENSADSAYVKLSSSGKVTAKLVYEERMVIVRATAADGSGVTDTFTVNIHPKDMGILILKQDGKNVTKSTVYADMNNGGTVSLEAHNLTGEEIPSVEWKSSRTAIATVENGIVTFAKPGSVTITATDVNDERKATVTVKAAALTGSVTITEPETGLEAASGKSITLKAICEDGASSKVTWSVTKGAAYAKISNKGKLTANKGITSAVEVEVTATAADGSGKSDTAIVTIRPIAQGVQIYSIDEATGVMVLDVDSSDSTGFLGFVRSNTNFRWAVAVLAEDGGYRETLQLHANVYPYEQNAAMNAIQGVTWKSSSKKVATVDENGLVTCLKPGSTTITATAKDGSGKKATFKLTVVKKIESLSMKDQEVKGGRSLDLAKKITIDPTDATNKTLTWEITGGNGAAYASINRKGVLKTKKVKSPVTVEVTATAQDGSEVSVTFEVEII